MTTLEPRQGPSEQDLMGVHGDVLFADPLGVRASPKAPQAGAIGGRSQAAYNDRKYQGAAGGGRPGSNRYNMEEEEDQGVLQTWFGFFFGPGSNCCSMRDRTKDAEAARAAATSGRPPSKFPEPRGREATRPLDEPMMAPVREEPRPPPPRSNSPPEDRSRFEANKSHQTVPPPLFEGSLSSVGNQNRGLIEEKAPAPVAPAPARSEFESPSMVPQQRQESPAPLRTPVPQAFNWTWPAWSLNSKEPCIEVYVQDEDGAPPRWCMAEPQFRVVDKDGNDAYLCAEYEWDGEFYVQDFGPQHVRKRGQTMTVSDTVQSNGLASGDDLLKDTKMVGRGDQGKGMQGFLEDTG